MGSSGFTHERSNEGATNVWLTPKHIIEALGPFDLDPCAAPEPRPWPTAARHIGEAEDGLTAPWPDGAFVWLNPPYGPHAAAWLELLASHAGGGIALLFARTETGAFFSHVWPKASALFFLKGRLKFCTPDGEPKMGCAAPSVLIAYGDFAAFRLKKCKLDGAFVRLR